MLKHYLGIVLLIQALHFNNTSPYIGGNQFGSYYTNPNLINNFLGQINSTIAPACNEIKGVGLPILAIKQVLQTIDSSLSYNNSNTYAKIIFFKEKKSTTTYQTIYKMVVNIRNFSTDNYLAIEGIYRQVGFPAFEVTTYYMDSNLDTIKSILQEYAFTASSYVGCGDVKSLYSQANPVNTSTSSIPAPYDVNTKISNSAPYSNNAQGNVDPNLIASIIKLLQQKN